MTHQIGLLANLADEYIMLSHGELVDRGQHEAKAQRQGARMSSGRMSIQADWVNVAKDLRLEWRSRDVFNSMMFFALLVVVVFSFAFERDESRPVMGGADLDCFSVLYHHGAQPVLGARAAQRRAGRLPRLTGAGGGALSGQVSR